MRYIKDVSGNTIAAAADFMRIGPVSDNRKVLTALTLAERTYRGIGYREPDSLDFSIPVSHAAFDIYRAAQAFANVYLSAQELETFYPVDSLNAFFTLRNIYLYRVYLVGNEWKFMVIGALNG